MPMSEQKSPSETAVATALLRAVACFEPDEKIRGRDNLARLFLPEEKQKKLGSPSYRSAVRAASRDGVYEYVIARTAYFDEIFANALQEAVPQIILLGAGYDSRAYRFAGRTGATGIFEVDAPFTQERKISILQANKIDCGTVNFVPVDFEKDDVCMRLAEKGYSRTQRTLLLWEGVTPYLSPQAVQTMLLEIRRCCREGVLAFDYLNRAVSSDQEIVRKDERVLFGMDKDEIENHLSLLGYRTLEHLGPSDIAARCLTGSDGAVFGTIKKTMCCIQAAI